MIRLVMIDIFDAMSFDTSAFPFMAIVFWRNPAGHVTNTGVRFMLRLRCVVLVLMKPSSDIDSTCLLLRPELAEALKRTAQMRRADTSAGKFFRHPLPASQRAIFSASRQSSACNLPPAVLAIRHTAFRV